MLGVILSLGLLAGQEIPPASYSPVAPPPLPPQDSLPPLPPPSVADPANSPKVIVRPAWARKPTADAVVPDLASLSRLEV